MIDRQGEFYVTYDGGDSHDVEYGYLGRVMVTWCLGVLAPFLDSFACGLVLIGFKGFS